MVYSCTTTSIDRGVIKQELAHTPGKGDYEIRARLTIGYVNLKGIQPRFPEDLRQRRGVFPLLFDRASGSVFTLKYRSADDPYWEEVKEREIQLR